MQTSVVWVTNDTVQISKCPVCFEPCGKMLIKREKTVTLVLTVAYMVSLPSPRLCFLKMNHFNLQIKSDFISDHSFDTSRSINSFRNVQTSDSHESVHAGGCMNSMTCDVFEGKHLLQESFLAIAEVIFKVNMLKLKRHLKYT